MGLPAIDYIVIGFYLIIMMLLGLYFSRFMKGGKDFFIGGNLIPWWVAGVSLYMTLFSAWTFTGAASFVYNTGWYGILYLATWPLSFFIGFRLAAAKWRRTRVTSPVEYVHTRFNRTTHLFLTLLVTVTMVYWPAHHLASMAKICAPTLFPNSMLAIDIMIAVTGIIILIYTFSGGLWAVCITDVIQFLILITVCVVLIPTAFLSSDLGSLGDFLTKIPPLKMNHIIRGNTPYTFWYLIGITAASVFSYMTGGNAQRYYSVKDEKSAQKVGWLAFALLMLGPVLFGVPPLIGKVLWPDISMLEYFANVMKADENIYIAVVMRYLPAGLVGIFLSAMMAASMSAMDSAWNATSAIISIDVYKTLFKPNATEKEVLVVGRITIVALCAIAIAMAYLIIHSELGIFTFSMIVFGLTGVPVAIPLLIGIMYRKMSRWAAMSSIIAGTLMAAICKFGLGHSLGPQYIMTVIITLFFIFSSYPLGLLYMRNKKYTLLINSIMGILLWIIFLTVNNKPELSLMTLGNIFDGTKFISQYSLHLWIALGAMAFSVLAQKFSKIYANDMQADQEKVDTFFKKMNTPINLQTEVFSKNTKEVNAFPLVGSVAIAMSIVSLLILLIPGTRTNISVNIAFSGVLLLIGLAMISSKYLISNKGKRK